MRLLVRNQPMVPEVKTRMAMVENIATVMPPTHPTSISNKSVLKIKTKGRATVRRE